jgi:hypothetical protein
MATNPLDDLLDQTKSFFYPDPAPVSYGALTRRRKIAEAIASRRQRDYPKNIGEGLTVLGEAIGERRMSDRLDAEEAAQEAIDKKSGAEAVDVLRRRQAVSTDPAAVAPATAPEPATPPRAAAVPQASPSMQAPPPLATPTRYTPPPQAGELTPDMLLREGRNRGEPVPLPLGSVSPAAPGPRSSLGDLRDRLAMADMARQGVVPPDPMIAQAPMPGTPSAVSTATGDDEDNPLTAMAQAGYLNPAIRTDIEKMSVPPPGARTPPEPPPPLPDVGSVTLPPLKPIVIPVAPTPTPPSKDEYDAMARVLGSRSPEVQRQWNAVVDRLKAERAATDARNIEKYKADMGYVEKERLAEQAAAREAPTKAAELRQKQLAISKAEDEQREQAKFGALGAAGTRKVLEDSHKANAQLPTALDAIATAKKLVENGTFTGPMSALDLNVNRARVLLGGAPDPRITNTEVFQATLAKMFGGLRPNVGGPGSQSNAEMEFLRQVAAGDRKFSKEAVLTVLHNLEKDSLNSAIQHQRSVNIASGLDPNDQRAFSHFSLPMERILPQTYIDQFKEKIQQAQGDPKRVKAVIDGLQEQFHTPGLAKQLLDAGRLD